MKHTWYVTFEVPGRGALVRPRSPRSTRTFETEAEAKAFARMKFDDGLIVTAGTINPHAPRTAIPSEGIPRWLEYGKDPKDPGGTQEPTSKTK